MSFLWSPSNFIKTFQFKLNHHMKSHTSDFMCDCCGKNCISEKALRLHKRKMKKCRRRGSSSSSVSARGKESRDKVQFKYRIPESVENKRDPQPLVYM